MSISINHQPIFRIILKWNGAGNYFASDPAVYGCLYHDGGSGLWNDRRNVFNHITSHIVFTVSLCTSPPHCSGQGSRSALYTSRWQPLLDRTNRLHDLQHGNSEHTTVTDLWYNDSEAPNLQGDTNRDVRDANGKCVNASITKLSPGQAWPAEAQAVIDNAGRRTGSALLLASTRPPPLSPPSAKWPPKNYSECNTPAPGPPGPPHGAFTAQPCKPGAASQEWLLSPGVTPGDSKVTNVKMAAAHGGGCWEIEACATGENAAVNCNWGCKPLPKSCQQACDCNGAWSVNQNGTITSVMDGKCLQVSGGKGSAVNVATCTGKANQRFVFKPSGVAVNATFTVQQAGLCVDQAARE